jgi:hypothetical protein
VEHIGYIAQIVLLGLCIVFVVVAAVMGRTQSSYDKLHFTETGSSQWIDLCLIQSILTVMVWLWLGFHFPASQYGWLKFWWNYCYLGLTPFSIMLAHEWIYNNDELLTAEEAWWASLFVIAAALVSPILFIILWVCAISKSISNYRAKWHLVSTKELSK